MITKQATITDIGGHPMSGLWTMSFDNGDTVFVESGTGVRALAACFDAHEGTGDLLEKVIGQEIVYSVDAFNILYGFTPANEWEGPEIPEEGIEEKEVEI